MEEISEEDILLEEDVVEVGSFSCIYPDIAQQNGVPGFKLLSSKSGSLTSEYFSYLKNYCV